MTDHQIPKTFWGLLGEHSSVIIPKLQRDYAQGRTHCKLAQAVRQTFLRSIHKALKEKKPLNLDFIYGEVIDGRLQVLDGQQRLTTLFLLHCYAAAKSGDDGVEIGQRLERFTYEVRPSSRKFCLELTRNLKVMASSDHGLSAAIKDQPWYQYLWDNDPTVSGMLVMLDEIGNIFTDVDGLWAKLTRDKVGDQPLLGFYFLAMEEYGLTADLYLKMNSRGKQLSDFEVIKAIILSVFEDDDFSNQDLAQIFKKDVDTRWSNLFWNEYNQDLAPEDQKGNKKPKKKSSIAPQAFDQPMANYVAFLLRCLTLWGTQDRANQSGINIEDVIRSQNALYEHKYGNLEFLIKAVDSWTTAPQSQDRFKAVFNDLFPGENLPLFQSDESKDLMRMCCLNDKARTFDVRHALLLFATIIHQVTKSDHSEFITRIRTLRNLLEYSKLPGKDLSKLPDEDLSKLWENTFRLIYFGVDSLPPDSGFNEDQVSEEKIKQAYIKANPGTKDMLERLEDHELLHGRLAILFDHENDKQLPAPATLETMARSFHLVFHPEAFSKEGYRQLVNHALLATGNYGSDNNEQFRQDIFATNDNESWRPIFTDIQTSSHLHRNTSSSRRIVFNDFLHLVSKYENHEQADNILNSIIKAFLDNSEFTWRYYFVKYKLLNYDVSRGEKTKNSLTGHFRWYQDPGSSPYNIRALTGKRLGSAHCDAYHTMVINHLPFPLDDGDCEGQWSTAKDKTTPLAIKGLVSIQCCWNGWQIKDITQGGDLSGILRAHNVENNFLKVDHQVIDPQSFGDDLDYNYVELNPQYRDMKQNYQNPSKATVDSEDRIEKICAVLNAILNR